MSSNESKSKTTSTALPHWPYPRWVAHRGAGKLAPENTMAAFRLGAAHGYTMFECDAKLSFDGVPFLLHDATLQRTTNGKGTASERDFGQLAQLDAGGWHSRAYAGEAVPSLEQLARYCIANGYFLNIEIKPTPGQEEETGRVVGTLAARWWKDEAVPPFFSSFKTESLEGARATAPHIPRGLLLDTLTDGWLATARQLECAAVVCNHALWNADNVAEVHAAGMRALSYTVNDAWAAQRLVDLGTDAIITDRVDRFSPELWRG
jgi:glycerophosphoryl diester phosphodiesterase